MQKTDPRTPEHGHHPAPRASVIVAFAAVYLIWGSTFLGIRFAVETLPPFLMGGARFLIAGLILYAWIRFTGTASPSRFHWGNAIVAAALLLGVGNGGVNWAEQRVPSGLAALIIAGTPVWFALFDWLRPHGARPTFQTILGVAVGFAGVTLLVGSPAALRNGSLNPAGIAALLLASMAWAIGSLRVKYTPKAPSPLMSAAQQMIAGGIVLLCLGAVLGEFQKTDWRQVSSRSLGAFVYLTFIGSLVGFTAYAWLLKATTPARVSTYAYVNPVIALFLGWAIGGEVLTSRMLWGAVVILLGVVIITARRPPSVPGSLATDAEGLPGAGASATKAP